MGATLHKEDAKQIGEIAGLVRAGDREGVLARTVNLGLRLISDVPLLGTLSEEGLRGILAKTSMGRMRKAVAEAGVETDRAAQAQAIAALVAETLGEALYDLHTDQQAIAAALGRLDERLGEVQAALSAAADELHIGTVRGGATGLVAEAGERRALKARVDVVTGRGTTGVIIKGR